MPKVFDCFCFMNELDVLDLRLHELASAVDTFVIVESREMHGSDRVKEPVLSANWKRFEPFWYKIIYVLLDKLQPGYTDSRSGWMRENFQRNALMAPVRILANPDDIVVVSDCDEIPKAELLGALKYTTLTGIHKLNLDFFYYNVNSYVGPWSHSTVGTLAQYEAAGGFQAPRGALEMPTPTQYPIMQNAGWHFSYFGGCDKIRFKMANFAHSSDSFVRETLARDDKQIAADIAARKDLYRRAGMQQFEKRSSDDSRLPRYFLENKQHFASFMEGGV